jgi:hypothetical protein
MVLQSYTLEQLSKLELLAFRKDWEDALLVYAYESGDCRTYSKYLAQNGIVKFIREYTLIANELERFDNVVTYLIDVFDINKVRHANN